jgi:hypothetical protein
MYNILANPDNDDDDDDDHGDIPEPDANPETEERPGLNFINVLRTAFTRTDPKPKKKSAQIKACVSMLVTSTLGLNFINVLRTAFALVDPKSVINTVKSSVSFYAFGTYKRKSCT